MTLFKRSEGTLEELNKVLASLETDTGSEIADKKRRLDQMTEMAEILGQNCSKLRKAAQESDPTKRTYGEQMTTKVLELCDRFDSLQPKITSVTASVSAAYTSHEINMAAQREQVAQAAAAAKEAQDVASAAKAAQDKKLAEDEAAASAAAAAQTAKDTAVAAERAAQTAVAVKAADVAATQKETVAAAATATATISESIAEATAAAAPAAGEMTLNLKSNVQGEGTTSITVPSENSTVMQLKEAIAAKMGHAAETQRLIFSGRVLDNANTMATYSIKSGCSLHLVVSKTIGAVRSPVSSPAAGAAGA
eukprot:CAMPEP_0179422386 /NCGR_PEP_ID=MMETSP0799-20121207/10400_1 /TAXON_ID=46947 /ORGANISM="Geminigera cryophila, Strain CCMP2564" /LENGTH=307 /DNA_ID=CAMNT_0021196513 /DNA_START=37 /DNA_END=957 /DNA_ORIENTATION=-